LVDNEYPKYYQELIEAEATSDDEADSKYDGLYNQWETSTLDKEKP
jgi:hypothetical protein